MSRLIRWLVAVALGAGLVVAPANAAAAGHGWPVLDGVELRYLPSGLGGSSDYRYHYQRVDFVSRVWESGSAATGWRVDLDVTVMRGKRLTTGRALHHWFIRYEQRPVNEVHYRRIRIHGRPGWVTRDEVFWLVRPGLAIAMTVDPHRYSRRVVLRTARHARAR